MKLLIAMLAAGLLGACPLAAQEAPKGADEAREKVEKEMDEAIKEALGKDLPAEVREALEKFRKENQEIFERIKKELEKAHEGGKADNGDSAEGDIDETVVETLPDGTKVVRRTVRKTRSVESREGQAEGKADGKSDHGAELPESVRKLKEEIAKLEKELEERIRKQLEDGAEDIEEVIEKDLPGGGKIKIVRKISRSTDTPKAPAPKEGSKESPAEDTKQ